MNFNFIKKQYSDLSVFYHDILDLIARTNLQGDTGCKVVLKNMIAEIESNLFERSLDLEKCSHIRIQKKKDYIIQKYYKEFIDKIEKQKKFVNDSTKLYHQPQEKNSCIISMCLSLNEKKKTLTVFFRAARVFPTLYCDLLALSEVMQKLGITKCFLIFNIIFLGKEIVLLNKEIPDSIKEKDFKEVYSRYKKSLSRPLDDIKMANLRKLKKKSEELECSSGLKV